MYIKIFHFLLILFLFFVPFKTFSQGNETSSILISEVSSQISLAPGLFIVDAYRHPSVGDAGASKIIDSESKKEIRVDFPYDNYTPSHLITENVILGSGTLESKNVVFFHEIHGDVTIIVKLAHPETLSLKHIGFINKMLVVFLSYNDPRTYAIVRISGDWEPYLGENYQKIFADINQDGIVNQLDLMLFSSEWAKTYKY